MNGKPVSGPPCERRSAREGRERPAHRAPLKKQSSTCWAAPNCHPCRFTPGSASSSSCCRGRAPLCKSSHEGASKLTSKRRSLQLSAASKCRSPTAGSLLDSVQTPNFPNTRGCSSGMHCAIPKLQQTVGGTRPPTTRQGSTSSRWLMQRRMASSWSLAYSSATSGGTLRSR